MVYSLITNCRCLVVGQKCLACACFGDVERPKHLVVAQVFWFASFPDEQGLQVERVNGECVHGFGATLLWGCAGSCHLFFLSGFVRESLTRWFSGRIPTEQTTV